jgi:hypothetical protein
VTSCFEFGPNLPVVVDLSVESDREATVCGRDRLVPAFHIDDAQATHSQPDGPVDEQPFVVGSAMHNAIAHALDLSAVHLALAITFESANDSTQEARLLTPVRSGR